MFPLINRAQWRLLKGGRGGPSSSVNFIKIVTLTLTNISFLYYFLKL
jgi:hypothetical protein